MVKIIETVYNFLWGDLLTLPLPGGGTLSLSLLVILLIPTGFYFTIRTRFLPIRLFKDMVGALFEKKGDEKSALSVIQTLIVSTATRVGMGNLVGVVAAISAGGAGAPVLPRPYQRKVEPPPRLSGADGRQGHGRCIQPEHPPVPQGARG